MILAVLTLLAAQTPAPEVAPPPETSTVDDAHARALAAEERAFAEVNAKQWCSATASFLEANEIEANPDFLFNAATAAELADDRARAIALFQEVASSSTNDDRKAEARAKAAALEEKVAGTGAGSPCDSPAAVPLPPVAPIAEAPREDPAPWPLISVVVGSATTIVGGTTLVIGALPWFRYLGAQQRLRALEIAHVENTAADQAEQTLSAADWNGLGKNTIIVGSVVTGLGVAAIANGITMMLLPDETTPSAPAATPAR